MQIVTTMTGRLGLRLAADYDTSHGKVKPYVRVNLWQELSDGSDTAHHFENTANNAGKTSGNERPISNTAIPKWRWVRPGL